MDRAAGATTPTRGISGSRGPTTSDGTLVVAWDEDDQPAGGAMPANDTFHHVLSVGGGRQAPIGPAEQHRRLRHALGRSVRRRGRLAGGLRARRLRIRDPAPGKDCNEFHGDYTGLAVDSLDRAHVVWTGLNRFVTSTQIDPYTGALHDGYAQDAMYARRP